MISKTLKIVIQSNGDYLDVSLPNIVANEKGRSVIQVIAPFPTTDIVSVNYSVRPIQADIPSQYLLPTGLFGKDVFAEDYTYFQTVAYWNVFEIPISSKALEYISKYRAGMVLASFTIAQQQVPYLAAEYKGTFDLENPIPTTNHNDGDYYVVNDYNFIWYGITWTKGDYAYYRNGEWIKGKNRLVAQASSIELPVDPSIKGQPTIDYDEDVALLLAQDLGLLTQRVSQSETDIESAENDINEIDGRVGINETDIENLESDVGNLQSDKADKTELVPINNELLRLEQDKADTTYVDAQDQALQSQIEGNDNDILSLQSTKVPKTTTIIGLDLQDNILIGEFRTALGNATQSVAGLLSAEDKTHLDGLVALLETSDGNNVVDTIGEILAIFQNYPEGADLVTVLQGKVDKVAGKGLSTNDFTDLLNAKLDSLLDGTQYYDKTYIDALKDNNGWESELLGTLSNNGTIALSIINQYDEIQMYAKDTLGVIDNENIRPNLMQSGDSVYFFDDTQAFIMVDTVFGFYAPAGYTLQVVGLKYTELKAEDVSTKEVGVSVQDKLDKLDEFDENMLLSTENDWDLETIFTEKFDNSRNGWVQVDNEFYVFGGSTFLGTGKDPLRSHELSKKAYKYNAVTKQLTELSDFPIAVDELRGVYKDGFIYLIGQNVSSIEDLDKTYKYEISTDTYTLITNPPVRIRCSSGAVLVGNKIYVFVDRYYTEDSQVTINTTPYIYDISLDSWSVGQPTNLTFDRGYAYYYNGLIYVQRSLTFQAYNPTTDTWVTDLTPPTYGLVHTGLMHEYKGRLFIGSGWETAKAKNNPFIQYYDVAEDKWFVATRLEFKNHALGYGSTFLYENKLYYIGGYSNEAEPNFNNVIRSFDLEKLQFEEIDYQRQLIQNKQSELVASDVATSEVGVSVQDKLDEIATEQNNLKNKDIEHETKLADHEQRIDSIEAITRKQDSDIASVDDDGIGILHMGKDVAETTVTTKIEGLLLDAPQLVTNGDFSNGITGWTGDTSLATVVNNQLVFNNTSGSYNSIYQDLNVNLNDKIYFSVNISVANDGFRVNYGENEYSPTYYQSSVAGRITEIFTANQGETVRLLVGASAGLSNTYDDVYVFNISTLIANRQYSPLYSTTFDLISDAQIKAQMDLWVQNGTLPNSIMSVDMDKRVTSVGKNLFDKSKAILDGNRINENDGLPFPGNILTTGDGYTIYIEIKPNTTYTWSGQTSLTYTYAFYDDDYNYINYVTYDQSFTTPLNAKYVRLSVFSDRLNYHQLEVGSVATTYEPYRSSSMYLDSGEVGYSFEGTTDSIEFRNGEALFINRVNDTQDGLRTTPIETPISVIGNAMAYPNGTFLIEDVVRRSGVYSSGITVDKPIKALDNIYKLNDDGSSTKLEVSGATIAGDGLSFTHTSLSNGDFVWFDYYYRGTNVKGLSTVYYYGDKLIVADTTTGTVYKIIFTIDNGIITVDKVEV